MKSSGFAKNWWMAFVLGILFVVLGVCALVAKDDAWMVLIVIAGVGLFFNGICNLFSIGASIPIVRKWVISDAIIDILLGALMISLPYIASGILSWVVGVILIVYAVGMLVEVCAVRPKNVMARLIIVSIIAIAFGVMFILDPTSFAKTTMIIIGAVLIALGVILCITSATIRFKKGKIMTDDEIADVTVTTYVDDSSDDKNN